MLIETYYFIDKFLEDEYILSLLISNNDGNVTLPIAVNKKS